MGGLRASDAEREQAIDRLREAAGEGRLTLEELSDRVAGAQGATTRGELELLVRDLPAAAEGVHAVPEVARVRALGDVKRSGAWVVPASSEFRSVFGHIRLDLREALVEVPEVVIHARAVFGDIDLLVPEGVAVDVRATARFGQIKQEAGGVVTPGSPRVVLAGATTFGTVRVRERRLWEKLGRLAGLSG